MALKWSIVSRHKIRLGHQFYAEQDWRFFVKFADRAAVVKIVDTLRNDRVKIVFLPIAEILAQSILEVAPEAFHHRIVARGSSS